MSCLFALHPLQSEVFSLCRFSIPQGIGLFSFLTVSCPMLMWLQRYIKITKFQPFSLILSQNLHSCNLSVAPSSLSSTLVDDAQPLTLPYPRMLWIAIPRNASYPISYGNHNIKVVERHALLVSLFRGNSIFSNCIGQMDFSAFITTQSKNNPYFKV